MEIPTESKPGELVGALGVWRHSLVVYTQWMEPRLDGACVLAPVNNPVFVQPSDVTGSQASQTSDL